MGLVERLLRILSRVLWGALGRPAAFASGKREATDLESVRNQIARPEVLSRNAIRGGTVICQNHTHRLCRKGRTNKADSFKIERVD